MAPSAITDRVYCVLSTMLNMSEIINRLNYRNQLSFDGALRWWARFNGVMYKEVACFLPDAKGHMEDQGEMTVEAFKAKNGFCSFT